MASDIKKVEYFNITVDGYAGEGSKLLFVFAGEGVNLLAFKAVPMEPTRTRFSLIPDGFNKTDLNKVLKEKECNTVFLCVLSAVGCVLATWIGAQNNDYKAFLIKDAIMSHNEDYTNNIEAMFDAVGPDVITLILENTGK